jgi:hypothetical protein
VKNNNTATSLLSFFVLWKFFAPNGLSVVSSVHVSFAHVLLAPNLYPQQQNCRHNDSQVRCLSMFMSATIRSTLTSVLQCTSWKNSFLHLSYNWNKTSLPAECSWKIIRIRCLARIENPERLASFWTYSSCGPLLGVEKKYFTNRESSANLGPSYPDTSPIIPMRLLLLLWLSLLPPCSNAATQCRNAEKQQRDFTNNEGSIQGTLRYKIIKLYKINKCLTTDNR